MVQSCFIQRICRSWKSFFLKPLEQESKEECKPAAFLIAGDILYKQGKTREAFSYYRKALKKDAPEYVRIEGADRVLKDLKDGSSYIRSFGKKAGPYGISGCMAWQIRKPGGNHRTVKGDCLRKGKQVH